MAKKPHKPHKGNWKPGESGNPNGRPKGSRNRIQEGLLQRVADHLDKFTESALNRMCFEEPGGYIRAAISLLPKEVNVNVDVDVNSGPVSELDRILAEFIASRKAKDIPQPMPPGSLLPAPICIEQEASGKPLDICEVQRSPGKPEWLSRSVGKGTLEE